MKTSIAFTTKTLVTATLVMVCTSVFSQITNTWKGGTPGMENEWGCPKNWSAYAVPDEFTNVVIPDVASTTLASPKITDGNMEVNALYLESGASLTIEKQAGLVVYGFAVGVTNASVKADGLLLILEAGAENGKAMPTANRN